jgi:chemotaxis protein CheD
MRSIAEAVTDDTLTPRRVVIGIGEFAVSDRPGDVIITHALGSCIAVCIYDPMTCIGGMLHFLLPEARINPERAKQQPAVFADTGIPLLFQAAFERGMKKQRAIVHLVGGAEMTQSAGAAFGTGRRNLLAAKNLLWRNGVFVAGMEVGGTGARTLHLSVSNGRLEIFNGQSYKEL